jgi:amino acid adenylation domain-containing protein
MKPSFRLSAEQRRRLRDELQRRGLEAGAEIRPRPDRDLHPPLSFAQQRLWFIDQLEPGRSIYNQPSALLLRGRLDVSALAGSLQEIVRRHEVLRTTFAVQGERPVQVIAPALQAPLPVVDLTALPAVRREELARALAAEEAARPFDLARGPLLRALLLRIESERHAAFLTLHHIVSDGWSMGVLVTELGSLYAALSQGLQPSLPTLPVQFGDFAFWQRQWLAGERMERELAWWRERLHGVPTVLDLPSDRPRPAVQSFRGERMPVRLGGELSRAVAALARASGGTVFLVLLAAFQAFLSRLTGQEDLVVGTPVANREQPETRGMIGFFVNFLVLRGEPSGDLPFADWLARVRESTLLAYDHQELPFEKLVEELQPERSLAHTPLFQVQLALQNARSGALELPGLTLEPVEAEWGGSRFDLTVSLSESTRGLAGFWEYSADLFDETTVARMAGQLEALLAGALVRPQGQLGELPLLSAAERHALLHDWNDSIRRPERRLLHEILAGRAAGAPESLAAVFAGTSLTYGELDRLSNRMARHLTALGVGPEVPVGVLVERSLEMLVGFFGILKAGGMYVPLDPAYPMERLGAMVEDSGLLVLVAQESLAEKLPGFWGLSVFLDPSWKALDGERDEPLSGPALLPDNVAYVIYTSGSTGRPKAVGVTHRGLANLAAAQVELFGLGPGDRVLQFAAAGFDASVWEIALAAGSGAALVLAPREALLPDPALESLLRNEAVTLATLPPSALSVLSPGASGQLPDLHTLILAGEACPPDLAHRWSADRRFFDAYGPTETAVCATAELYRGEGRLTIGRPLANFAVYVLDRRRELAAISSPGELCAGGLGLARGYLGRPDLTAERFIPHPFAQEPGARLYRTGDLAIRLPDGRVDFLGRIDHQVKIRGFRIEPGEIEGALRACPGVREAVVIPRQDLPGGRGLTAFLVPQEEAALAPEELRERLRESLPEHMVPAAWCVLDRLPLTPNGKVDRREMERMPLGDGGDRSGSFVAPRTPFEEMVAGLFADLFGAERVSMEESFFDLGGHSLLAAQLVSRIRAAFGIEVPLQLIFEKPTAAALAAALELRWGGEGTGEIPPPLLPVARTGELPLSFAQERLWFIACLAPQSAAYNMPSALRLCGHLNIPALACALGEVVRRHEVLRTTFQAAAGRPAQRIAPPAPVPLPLIELSGLPPGMRAAEARRLATEDALHPFDLQRGPLLRLALARLGPEEHLALLNLHHIVSDGWSTGLLVQELTALYAAFQQGRPSPLPELPVQYADFAAWQRQRLSGETLEAQLAWWRDGLGDEPPPLELPTDRPLPAVQSYRGGSVSLLLPAPLAGELNALGRRQGATLFMVLLAAWQALLGRYSGQEDLAVGAPVAGRDHRETEGLIGLFLNTLVLRADLRGTPGFRELLARVRETALGAYSHREVPFEKLVEELRPRRDLARHPFVDVLLNVVNTPPVHAGIPGLEILSEPVTEPSSKFALTLYAFEGAAGLHFNLVYQAALFDPARAASILDQLAGLLEQVAAEPERPIGSYSLVTQAARALLPDPALPMTAPHHDTVPALVEAWAHRAPEAPAVRQGGRDRSYAELAAAAVALARRLAQRTERRNNVVAVSGPPSFGLIAAMLAVLRSGATMLTIDPSLPPARQRRMVQEAAARCWLQVEEPVAGAAPRRELDGLAVLSVDAGSGRLVGAASEAGGEAVPPPPLPEPGEPAYIFFTSGTTGTPKGVLGRHLGLGHFLAWQREAFAVGPGDRCAQLTALSFDVLLRDVFLAITSGATLCLPDAARPPAVQVLPWLEREGITILHTLPAVAQSWIGSVEKPLPLPVLRCVFFAGEPLTGALVRRWRQTFPGDTQLVNLYGPTETTLAKCCFVVPAEPGPGVQPVGYPLPETQALVLGPEDRLCGISEAGEIVLRTPFRTLGYLNAPEEDRSRFVANPFRDDPADLLYRTGDRGRYRPDSSLEILGRLDDQVKVRGVRVEPGEIEVALVRHPAVAAAAVVARADRTGEKELIAYVARAEGHTPAAGALREHLRQELPEPMLPAAFVVLDALPRTATGKIDRRALPAPEAAAPREEHTAPRTALERAVAEIWQDALRRDHVGLHDNFFDLGGHSLLLVEVHARLSRLVTGELPLVELFRHPTVSSLARFLEGRTEAGAAPAADQAAGPTPQPAAASGAPGRSIAIVGMAGRFPDAADVEQLWSNLCRGVESVRRFTDEELLASGVAPDLLASPRYVKAGTVLDGADRFDAAFFNITPREADILDPQHRLFLECAWEVLERAGYDPQRHPHPIGVYAGVQRSNYVLNLYSHPELVAAVGHTALKHGTDKDYVTTRVSYKLGLRGPSLTVQTTCSTSLVAVHLACQAILAGECRMALAGGVSVRMQQEQGYIYEEGDILSPDGHTRSYDAAGRGTLPGNGLGLVLLKRLEDALADGDTIHAVIRGTAINNDGADRVGYTAPSIDGQSAAITAAWRAAGIDPETISCVEGHGTATALGDPIEVAALTRAFRDGGVTRKGFCALGSVKSNVGHLDTAAGVTGLIKTALALEHGLIPPSLHFERPNPNLDLENSPFYVNTALAEWRTDGAPRRAGVSSFGIGGTNAHAVLEQAPPAAPSGPSRPWQLLLLSARTPAALDAATARLADHLESHPDLALADVAYTLQVGRRTFEHRRAVVCHDREDALVALRSPERWMTGAGEAGRRPVAFLFPGQGAQHAGMGRDLYASEPIFRETIDSCADLLAPHLGLDLRSLLFPPGEEADAAGRTLTETRFAQPALFVVEYALARLWMAWGIRPAAMLGHSLGEYVAACLAGVFSLPDALHLIAARGRLMQQLPPGAMLAVSLPAPELQRLLVEHAPDLSLAVVNAPALGTVSGPFPAIDAFATRLAERGVEHRRLHTSHAFHSAMMEPALRPFAELAGGLELQAPRLRYLSNLTGTWARATEATDPGSWARHLREPVHFSEGLAALLAEPGLVLLEAGPGHSLATLVRQHDGAQPVIGSLRPSREEGEDPAFLLRSLGRLWLAGVEPDWSGFYALEQRRRVPLPTYPFERQRFWVEMTRPGLTRVADGPAPDRAQSLEDLRDRLTNPQSAELLERLLALEPGLRVTLPPVREAGTAPAPALPAARTETLAGRRRPDLSTPWQEPRNDLERRIAAVWEELLGIHGIGVHDDFFELGGHSLLATRLVSRLREVFRRELPLDSLFAGPTVARLAARLHSEELAAPTLPPIERVPREGPLPLSFAQQRLLFLHVLAPGDVSYNQPLGLRLRGSLDLARLCGALRGLVARHEVLRTTFSLTGEEPLQHIWAAGAFELPLLDLSGLPGPLAEREALRCAEDEARRPFDLFLGPVLRAVILRLQPDEHVLLVDIHHIAVDGWSWGVFCREMAALYEKGEQAELPELRVQYADFAVWQRRWLQGEALDRQLEYWRERLSGLPPVELPADRARPAVRSGRGAVLPMSISGETVDALRSLSRQEDATLFMTLLAAFFVLLRSSTRKDILVAGTDIANRTRAELEGLMGLFVNQLVLRCDLADNPTFREILQRVRRETLEAYAHQDAPFDRLVEILNPVRDMSRTPLFQVKLVLQNTPFDTRRVRGLSIAPLEVPRNIVKFDLLLNLLEGRDGIAGSVEYSTGLFEASTIVRLLDGFAIVLRTVSERPDVRLGEIDSVLAGIEAQREEERDRERRSASLARARRQVVVTQPAS